MSIIPDIEKAIERQVALLHRIHVGGRNPLSLSEAVLPVGTQETATLTRKHDELGTYVILEGARPLFRDTKTPRRVLRVEIEQKYESDLWLYLRTTMYPQDTITREGPFTIHDVDTYIVRRLPSPGWRVINPLEKL